MGEESWLVEMGSAIGVLPSEVLLLLSIIGAIVNSIVVPGSSSLKIGSGPVVILKIMKVRGGGRANWDGPIEFVKMVFSKISRKLIAMGFLIMVFSKYSGKLIAILWGPKAFLIL